MAGDLEGGREAVQPVLDLPVAQRIHGVISSVVNVHRSITSSAAADAPVAREMQDEIETYCRTPAATLARWRADGSGPYGPEGDNVPSWADGQDLDAAVSSRTMILRRAERKLRKAQKALSRTARGSANRDKAQAKVARVHARVADTRRDWLHKESTRIIRENQAVYVEDLCVAGLGWTRLAKSVHDAGWSAFTSMLEYKAHRHGRAFGKTGRFEPTSQVCSACGVKDGPKPLSVREWTCTACGTIHDRDVNAARNILAAGRADSLNACEGDVRPGPALAVAGEAGSLRGAA